jgi:hypothetical protein
MFLSAKSLSYGLGLSTPVLILAATLNLKIKRLNTSARKEKCGGTEPLGILLCKKIVKIILSPP